MTRFWRVAGGYRQSLQVWKRRGVDGDGTYFESIIFEGTVVTVKRFGNQDEPFNPILSADWRAGHSLSKREMDRLWAYVLNHWDKGDRPPRRDAPIEPTINW